MRSIDRSFYESRTWRHVREAYAESQHGLCERCAKNGRITPGVIVHHKEHLTPENVNDPKKTYGWDNLELLCLECHNAVHGKGQKPTVIFDEEGNCIGAIPPVDDE